MLENFSLLNSEHYCENTNQRDCYWKETEFEIQGVRDKKGLRKKRSSR